MRRVLRGASLILVGMIGVACSSAWARTAAPPPAAPAGIPSALRVPASTLGPDQVILHALNRLGYGPRPGDVERVRRMGVAAYIERQLDPGGIPDAAVEQALASYPVLAQSAAALYRDYPPLGPQVQQRLAPGERSRPGVMETDPAGRPPPGLNREKQAAR